MKSIYRIFTLILSLTLISCGGTDSPKSTEIIAPVNIAPTVSIENETIVFENMEVQLVANAQDTDGTIASYTWMQTQGTTVELLSTSTPSTSFTVPTIDVDEEITFEVTVTDNNGASSKSTSLLTLTPRKFPSGSITINDEINENEELLITLKADDVRGIESYAVVFSDERVTIEQQTNNTFIVKFPDTKASQHFYFNWSITTINNLSSYTSSSVYVINDGYDINITGSNGIRPHEDIYKFDVRTVGKPVTKIEVSQTFGPKLNIIIDKERISDGYSNEYNIPIPFERTSKQHLTLLITVTFEDNYIKTYEKTINVMESKTFEYHDIDVELAQNAIKEANSLNPELSIDWNSLKITNTDNDYPWCNQYEDGLITPQYYRLIDINQDGLDDIYFYFYNGRYFFATIYCEGFILAESFNSFTGLSFIKGAYHPSNGGEPQFNFYDITGDGYLDRLAYNVTEENDAFSSLYSTSLIKQVNGIEVPIATYNKIPLEYSSINDHYRRESVSGHFVNHNEFNIIQLSTNFYTDFVYNDNNHLNATRNSLTISHIGEKGTSSEEFALDLGDDIAYSLHKGDINNDGIVEIILRYKDQEKIDTYNYKYITF